MKIGSKKLENTLEHPNQIWSFIRKKVKPNYLVVPEMLRIFQPNRVKRSAIFRKQHLPRSLCGITKERTFLLTLHM